MDIEQTIQQYLPEESMNSVQERVEKHWDLSTGIPLPKFQITCVQCDSTNVLIRQVFYHQRNNSVIEFRAVINFKCRECSTISPLAGVPVSEEIYNQMKDIDLKHHSKIKSYLEKHLHE